MREKKDQGENLKIKNRVDAKLKDFIFVADNIIPNKVCDHVIKIIENEIWVKHQWVDKNSNRYSEKTKELSIYKGCQETQEILTPYINETGQRYIDAYHYPGDKMTQIVDRFSTIRFNRYFPGEIMRQHYDHIHSIFDGEAKGIPVLSIILNLNDNYSGGELYFWEDYNIKLKKGDIVMFPSVFLYPHGVKEVTDGVRYSGVSWAW